MPTVLDFEIDGYRREIAWLREGEGHLAQEGLGGGNLTHHALGLSNRANMILVGMCSLVEALLCGIALECASSPEDAESILDLDRSSLTERLQSARIIDFGHLKNWSAFCQLMVVRNAIVHGHGGIVPRRKLDELKRALRSRRIGRVLVGGRRIRMDASALESCLALVAGVIRVLLAQRKTEPHDEGMA